MHNIAIFSPGVYSVFFNELISYAKKDNFSINGKNVNWFILTNSNIYIQHLENNINKNNICYLFENFNSFMEDDKFNIDLSSYKGSLYKDILTDKHSFFKKNASYQLRNASVIYYIWKEFLLKNNIDYLIFPDVEYVEGMILLSLCEELDIKVLYYVHGRNIGKSFFARNVNEEPYSHKYSLEDSDFVSFFELVKENSAYSVLIPFNQNQYDDKINKYYRTKMNKILVFIKNKFFIEKHYLKEDMSFIIRVRMQFLNILNKYRKSRKYIYKKYVTVNNLDEVEYKYIYFPLQVTPESSINNLEPYFIDQIRAIDLLLMNIKPEIKILVKEHPAFAGERIESFYKILSNKPGVEICSLDIKSDELIDKSILVSSITGTAIFEAMLKDKSTFQFGKTFFSQKDFTFDSFLSLKKELELVISKDKKNNIEEIIKNLYPLLFEFYIEQPMQYYYQPKPVALMNNNLSNTLDVISFYIEGLESGTIY